MKKILCILFFGQLCFCCAVAADGSSGNKDASDLYNDLVGLRGHAALTNVLKECQMLPWEEQENVLARCIKNMSSSDKVSFDEPVSNGDHDLSLLRGRCAWLVSNMLSIELPLINATTPKKSISEAKRIILKSIKKKRDEAAPSKDEVFKKTLGERRDMALNASSTQLLSILAMDKDVGVRRIAAANEKTHPSVLAKLAADDPDPDVRKAAIENLEKARTLKLKK